MSDFVSSFRSTRPGGGRSVVMATAALDLAAFRAAPDAGQRFRVVAAALLPVAAEMLAYHERNARSRGARLLNPTGVWSEQFVAQAAALYFRASLDARLRRAGLPRCPCGQDLWASLPDADRAPLVAWCHLQTARLSPEDWPAVPDDSPAAYARVTARVREDRRAVAARHPDLADGAVERGFARWEAGTLAPLASSLVRAEKRRAAR